MKLLNKITYTAHVSAIALMMAAAPAGADVVRGHVSTDMVDQENVTEINFSAFDLNRDGILDKTEVGEKLFYLFDLDGNEVIDNIEWNRNTVYTIIPMEQKTFTYVDYDEDGDTDQVTYTYDQFYIDSGLAVFDQDNDGLSPHEFVDTPFLKLDGNDDGVIELEEWQDAYRQIFIPESAEQERYN